MEQLRQAMRPLRGQSHLLKLSELMESMEIPREDCIAALDVLVDSGELRRTCDSRGEAYYWFVGGVTEPSPCE